MIYHHIWYYVGLNDVVSGWNAAAYPEKHIGEKIGPRYAELADFIKSSEDDSFIFILGKANGDYKTFTNWLDEYGLRKLVVLETKGSTNPVHPDRKDNLVLFVLQSEKHFQREKSKELV